MAKKVLFQSNPVAATLTDAYTAPSEGVCSTIVVANRSATSTTFRISVAVAGAVDNNKQYIAYDAAIGANEVWTFTIGATFGNTDVIRVYATLATLAFSGFGSEG